MADIDITNTTRSDVAGSANASLIVIALAQAIIDMQAIIDTADIPAGTLTAAQLSTFIRTAQSQLKTTALRVKQAARLLNGDFSSST